MVFKNQTNILLIGRRGSGKTALGFSILLNIAKKQKKKMFLYKHPNIETVQKGISKEIQNVTRFEELCNLTDAVVMVDETGREFDTIEKKINMRLRKILSLSRQNNISFIFIAQSGEMINKSLFSLIDCYIFKQVNRNHFETERRHIKKLYEEEVMQITTKGRYFIDYPEGDIYGFYPCSVPNFYTEKISNSYRLKPKKELFKIEWL